MSTISARFFKQQWEPEGEFLFASPYLRGVIAGNERILVNLLLGTNSSSRTAMSLNYCSTNSSIQFTHLSRNLI